MSNIVINNISWNYPNGSNLFNNITFACSSQKTGLVGINGVGKTILAKIICGLLNPSTGNISKEGSLEYFPQDLSIYNNMSILDVFNITNKHASLQKILKGFGNIDDFITLDDDWNLENRIDNAKRQTGIEYIDVNRNFSSLSGGEKVRTVLSSLLLNNPNFIIFDEPTNHLDYEMKEFIYNFVNSFNGGLLIISHDRELLGFMDRIIELTPTLAKIYGGNYDVYFNQHKLEIQTLENNVHTAENLLDKRLKEKEQILTRQKNRTKTAVNGSTDSGIPKIMLNKLKGQSEHTFSKLKDIHTKRIEESRQNLDNAKLQLPIERKIKIDYNNQQLPNDKYVITCNEVNYSFSNGNLLWGNNINFVMRGNERIHLKGINGSGKSTLLKLIGGDLLPTTGLLKIGIPSIGYLDQDVSMLDNNLTILENMLFYSNGILPECELRIRLARLLFFNDDVYKKVAVLSGGEKMRAAIACLFAANNSPFLILLDEPTNNLDLVSINQLTIMLNSYKGTLIVVSHDKNFINDIGLNEELILIKQR
ncbi:MAG: ATP-binding cassette domain-containing protein [bacterium]